MSSNPSSTPRHRIDSEAGLAYVRFEGVVTGRDMLAAARALHADPAWSDGFDVIWDCSAVRKHVVGPEEVKPILQEEEASGSGRDVLVESANLRETLFSEMMVRFLRHRGKPASVCGSLEDALGALGQDRLPDGLASPAAPHKVKD